MSAVFRRPRPIIISPSGIATLTKGPVSIALSGTIIGATEADTVAGGKTIILTVTNDEWVAAGATFDAQRQPIINGLTSAQSETLGWNNTVKLLQGVAGVVRTSNNVVTITLDAQATYNITADETITDTVPGTALVLGNAVVASPTFGVVAAGAVDRVPLWINIGMQGLQLYGQRAA